MSQNKQFDAADAAVDGAVDRFFSEIEQMQSKWQDVAAAYISERALLKLCDGLTKLIDDPLLADNAGPAALKLSNALLDYRDSLPTER